jgi:hypothetical protein
MIVWKKGGTAVVIKLEEDAITLRSSIPSPPGSRIDGDFDGRHVRVKIHNSRKQADGSFELSGRTIDCARDTRLAFIAAIARANEVNGGGDRESSG